MPSLEMARRISSTKYNGAKTIGQIHKENSDFAMEYTWPSDIQSKVCYVYDYAHDDSPALNEGMTYENTTKTKIDAKFIITSYGSVDKDQVAYHLLFKPSQKLRFDKDDELYYYETEYKKKRDMTFPTGLYVDIPDGPGDEGVYHRWLIIDFEEANQFMKYVILPCEYRFQWIEVKETQRYKRQSWCCIRGQNSYTSGLWNDRYITSLDDVNKIWLPLNDVTENINYLNGDGKSQRVIFSAKVPKPLTWQISKIENEKPVGILKVTLKEDEFNPNSDYVEKDDDGIIVGMWADYYSVEKNVPVDDDPTPQPAQDVTCTLTCSASTIKAGGSFRSFTATYADPEGNDVSDEYAGYTHEWRIFLDEVNGTRIDDLVEIKQGATANVIKVKFPDDRKYLNHFLVVDLYTNSYVYGSVGQTVTIIG